MASENTDVGVVQAITALTQGAEHPMASAIVPLVVAGHTEDNSKALILLQEAEKHIQAEIRRRIHAGAHY